MHPKREVHAQVREQLSEVLQSLLGKEAARSGREAALVIDGKALLHALKDDLSASFLEVTSHT